MSSENLTSLVPVIYYDLIARVASGAPFALIAAKELQLQVWGSGALLALVVFGGGYVAGSLLSTISCINFAIWRPWAIRRLNVLLPDEHPLPLKPLSAFSELYRRIDFVTERSRYEGSVLEKMEAGAAFAENLTSGILVCWILQGLGWIEGIFWIWYLVLTLFLMATGILRRILLAVRHGEVYKRLSSSSETPNCAPPADSEE